MLQRFLISGIIILFFITGCALSPQSLTPNIEINQKIIPYGKGQAINLSIMDKRKTNTLGSRGGIYPDTSQIIVDTNALISKIKEESFTGSRLMGFTPNDNASNLPELVITITELSYMAPTEVYSNESDINTVLTAEVKNTGRTLYEARYNAGIVKRFVTPPSADDNSELIGEALSDALTRIFLDQNIANNLIK